MTTDECEWVDITNEVQVATNLEQDHGTIAIAKWPGLVNLKVLRRKEKFCPTENMEPWDGIEFRSVQTKFKAVVFGVTATSISVIDNCGGKRLIHPSQVIAVWRNGQRIYNAETTSTDTPASLAKSD